MSRIQFTRQNIFKNKYFIYVIFHIQLKQYIYNKLSEFSNFGLLWFVKSQYTTGEKKSFA